MSIRNVSGSPTEWPMDPRGKTIRSLQLELEVDSLLRAEGGDQTLAIRIATLRVHRHMEQLEHVITDALECIIEDGHEPFNNLDMARFRLEQKAELLRGWLMADEDGWSEELVKEDPNFFEFAIQPLRLAQRFRTLMEMQYTQSDSVSAQELFRLSTEVIACWQALQWRLIDYIIVRNKDVPLSYTWDEIYRYLGLWPQVN